VSTPNDRWFLEHYGVTEIDDGEPDALVPDFSPNGAEPVDAPPPFALDLDDFIAQRQEGKAALLGTEDDNVLPAGGLALLAALPGKGKTTLAVDLAFHLASGADWLGIPVPEPLDVLVIENEGPREPFRRKLEAKAKAWPHPIGGAIRVHVLHWGRFTLDDEAILADLEPALEGVDIVIGDPLTTLGVRGVGSPADTRDFVARLAAEILTRGSAALLLHHFRHGSTRGDAAGDELDELSGAWAGHADSILVLKDEAGDRARLSFPKLRWANPRDPLILARLRDEQSFEVVAEARPADELRNLDDEILRYLEVHGPQYKKAIKSGIVGRDGDIIKRVDALHRAGLLDSTNGRYSVASQRVCPADGHTGHTPCLPGEAEGVPETYPLSLERGGSGTLSRPGVPEGCARPAEEPGS
jgi:hypothetical protein